MNKRTSSTFEYCIEILQQQGVIAYPTEAVFGLGCDPDSEQAVRQLLTLKQRPIEKGLILIAADYQQLLPYVADEQLTPTQRHRMNLCWPGAVSWVLPARSLTPKWLTGRFNSLAVRVSSHPDVRLLCQTFGKPLVSTSANLTGQPPCRTYDEVLAQFGHDFPVYPGETSGRKNPSEIRDIITGELFRQG
ncbi:L-threonylcarbamoyladenylate synthase type 1 TsaC [Enterobacteriaceae bacterium LUAb1]